MNIDNKLARILAEAKKEITDYENGHIPRYIKLLLCAPMDNVEVNSRFHLEATAQYQVAKLIQDTIERDGTWEYYAKVMRQELISWARHKGNLEHLVAAEIADKVQDIDIAEMGNE